MKAGQIYLDHNASTPLIPEVIEAMHQCLNHVFGNPSSTHWAGKLAHDAIEKARYQVANLLGAFIDEITFTSGGTESNNLAIRGAFQSYKARGNHIVTSRIEHPATYNVCRDLEEAGVEVSYLPVDSSGIVNPSDVLAAIRPDTVLISIMHANNETGTLQPIKEISEIAKVNGVLFHTDAAQSVGKIPVNIRDLGVDLLSIAGHKLNGPKGSGALYTRRGLKLTPLLQGAEQEQGVRPGTEPLPAIVGLGTACKVAKAWVESDAPATINRLRKSMWNNLKNRLADRISLNGDYEKCLPNTLSISFPEKHAKEILGQIPELAASQGSACHAGSDKASRVLTAMGKTESEALGTIRISLGRNTRSEELTWVSDRIVEVVLSNHLIKASHKE